MIGPLPNLLFSQNISLIIKKVFFYVSVYQQNTHATAELNTLEVLPEFPQGSIILGTTPMFPIAELDTLGV